MVAFVRVVMRIEANTNGLMAVRKVTLTILFTWNAVRYAEKQDYKTVPGGDK